MTSIPPLFKHQKEDSQFHLDNPRSYNASDPGTGKTRTLIEVVRHELATIPNYRAVIVAPKSILQASWGNDFDRFAPECEYRIAWAGKRTEALRAPIMIINTDGVNWLERLAAVHIHRLIVDEATCFKDHNAQRSRFIYNVAERADAVTLLSGTPAPNSVVDLWNQYRCLDPSLLGENFYAFRNWACTPTPVTRTTTRWTDKPGAMEAAAEIVRPITVRRKLEDITDMPERVYRTIAFKLPSNSKKIYKQMLNETLIELSDASVNAGNAGIKFQKLLQIASGAVYDDQGGYQVFDNERNKLILDLVMERPASLVAFFWRHQRETLIAEAKQRNIPFNYIDGTVSGHERNDIVTRFQNGEYRVLFVHPRATSHGLTLIRGEATIWASPPISSESYIQLNNRIYRIGQKKRTETIHIAATDTLETLCYSRLNDRISALSLLNELIAMRKSGSL